VVELVLFCPFYGEEQWRLSPLHSANNINGTSEVARTNVYTLDRHGGLLAVQERMVRKVVRELRDFDNVFYEICNEPYFGGVTLEWQHHVADLIVLEQAEHPAKKLIAQNIANGSARVSHPHPAVSILNFHYAEPPTAVEMNTGLGAVIGDDETGFRGTNDVPYRLEGWDFVMAGGGLFNNLDYSFVVGHEDGSFVTPASAPGGGNAGYRRSLRALGNFIRGFDFVRLQPDRETVKGGVPEGMTARTLSQKGLAYAIYLRRKLGENASTRSFNPGEVVLEVELPTGRYTAVWVDTKNGEVLAREVMRHTDGRQRMAVPAFVDDVALAIRVVDRP
jgi:hypothetical protein